MSLSQLAEKAAGVFRQNALEKDLDDPLHRFPGGKRLVGKDRRGNDAVDRCKVGAEEDLPVDVGPEVSGGDPLIQKPVDVGVDPVGTEGLHPLPESRQVAGDILLERLMEFTDCAAKEEKKLVEFFDEIPFPVNDVIHGDSDLPHEPLHDLGDQVFLAREELVESLLAHPKFGGDVVNGDAGKPFAEKPMSCEGHDPVLGAALFVCRHHRNSIRILGFRSFKKNPIF